MKPMGEVRHKFLPPKPNTSLNSANKCKPGVSVMRITTECGPPSKSKRVGTTLVSMVRTGCSSDPARTMETQCNCLRLSKILLLFSAEQPWQFTSASDLYMNKLMQTSTEELISNNKRFLCRVFPNCSRVDSSNFNPQDMWNFGCQIGMLLLQTRPRHMIDYLHGENL